MENILTSTLLIGANGFLGKYVSKELYCKNISFDSITRSPYIKHCNHNYNFDLSENEIVIPRLSYRKIVHCAGLAHRAEDEQVSPDDYHTVNVNGLKKVLDAVDRADSKPEIFVYISSVSVYGLDAGISINEDHPLLGISPYAKSKIDAEKLLLQWSEKSGVGVLILRLPLVVGNEPKGNLAKLKKQKNSFIRWKLTNNLAKKSIVHASDVAKLVADTSNQTGVYNLTDGEQHLFNEISEVMAPRKVLSLELGIPVWFIDVLAKFGDLLKKANVKFPVNTNIRNKIYLSLTFDCSAAQRELNWSPKNALKFKLT